MCVWGIRGITQGTRRVWLGGSSFQAVPLNPEIWVAGRRAAHRLAPGRRRRAEVMRQPVSIPSRRNRTRLRRKSRRRVAK